MNFSSSLSIRQQTSSALPTAQKETMILKQAAFSRALLCLSLGLLPAYGQSSAETPRLNQIQVLGSHNSYKQAIDPALLTTLRESMGDRLQGLEYSHIPLANQLDLGLRSLELDVVHDPQGGLYATPRGLEIAKQQGSTLPVYDPAGEMKKPGLKVLHVPDIDFRSHAYTFRQALEQLKQWSDAHPRHLPIVITMNAKADGVKRPGFVQPLPFDRVAFDAWDAEIRSVLPPTKLLVPDDVRQQYATLEQAVRAHAWPALESVRGRFLFVLDETSPRQEIYIEGHPSLRGRVMFVNAEEGQPEAAFRIVNEPKENLAYIQYLVRSGYLVRTRADADTREARQNDYTRWKAALASGAHIITTDYYAPDPKLQTGYAVKLPGGVAGLWNTLLLPSMRPLPAVE